MKSSKLREVLSELSGLRHTTAMKSPESIYRGRHFSPSIIGYAVWTYHRFHLSLRDVEDLLAERGSSVSYETIRLPGYAAAKREMMPGVPHWRDRYANNRCEVPPQHTREQERRMRKFKSRGRGQRFLSVHRQIQNLFRHGRQLTTRVLIDSFAHGHCSCGNRSRAPEEWASLAAFDLMQYS